MEIAFSSSSRTEGNTQHKFEWASQMLTIPLFGVKRGGKLLPRRQHKSELPGGGKPFICIRSLGKSAEGFKRIRTVMEMLNNEIPILDVD